MSWLKIKSDLRSESSGGGSPEHEAPFPSNVSLPPRTQVSSRCRTPSICTPFRCVAICPSFLGIGQVQQQRGRTLIPRPLFPLRISSSQRDPHCSLRQVSTLISARVFPSEILFYSEPSPFCRQGLPMGAALCCGPASCTWLSWTTAASSPST